MFEEYNDRFYALKKAKEDNTEIFRIHYLMGSPEANDALNESNFKVIEAYKAYYPKAKGYTFAGRVVNLDGELHNFCCDIIFNATKENLQKIHDVRVRLSRGEKIEGCVDIIDVMCKFGDGFFFVWS